MEMPEMMSGRTGAITFDGFVHGGRDASLGRDHKDAYVAIS